MIIMVHEHRRDAPDRLRRPLPADECVLRYMLEKHARLRPEHDAVAFESGDTWSFAELLARVSELGRKLQDLGVRQGDAVLVWMPNGPELFTAWYSINFIGAVYVPMNTAYRGRLLAHVVSNSGAKIALIHADLLDRLRDIDTGNLEKVVVFNGAGSEFSQLQVLQADDLVARGAPLPLGRTIAQWDTQAILYTSGTTGPSKGVLVSYAMNHAAADAMDFVTQKDRSLCLLPLFHAGGVMACYSALLRGCTLVLMNAFSTETFWHIVRRFDVTHAGLLGVMCSFLAKRPLKGDEAGHKLRQILSIPLTHESMEFAKRFSVDVYTVYGMTEIALPLISEANPSDPGYCGKPRAGVEVRIVDENDFDVGVGKVGELILRTDNPWELTIGYHQNTKATADAWRNGWFHTGDAFRVSETGRYYFVDRIKDAIRRRGENISSYEVETEVGAHPAIREAAALAIASPESEDEVLVAVSLVEGANLDPAELIAFLVPRMPHFMVPRYVRILPDLPKTPTHKVMKHALRDEGLAPGTWDREQHGISIKRDRFDRGGRGPGGKTKSA